jgi:hypothetical protein
MEIPSEWGPGGKPKKKVIPITKLWMKSDKLLTAPGITFQPGAPILTVDPEGEIGRNGKRRPRIRFGMN